MLHVRARSRVLLVHPANDVVAAARPRRAGLVADAVRPNQPAQVCILEHGARAVLAGERRRCRVQGSKHVLVCRDMFFPSCFPHAFPIAFAARLKAHVGIGARWFWRYTHPLSSKKPAKTRLAHSCVERVDAALAARHVQLFQVRACIAGACAY